LGYGSWGDGGVDCLPLLVPTEWFALPRRSNDQQGFHRCEKNPEHTQQMKGEYFLLPGELSKR
jgi:hypothetical protein